MSAAETTGLFWTTLRRPREAAQVILDLRLPDRVLWAGLILVAVIATLFVSLVFQIAELPDDQIGQIVRKSLLYRAPLVAAAMQWGQLVILIFVLHWVGLVCGGKGSRRDILALFAWLQFVTIVLIAGLFVLSIALPVLANLAMLAVIAWWLYALVCFIEVGHRLDTTSSAVGVVIASIVGFFLGTTLILSLIGGIVFGVSGG